jgi:4-amino-4-deoxy-L-arabinose transferase-like glycosyltransferase
MGSSFVGPGDRKSDGLAGLSDQEERSCDFNRRLRNIILILLLLAAFALRPYRLDHQEFWGDEAFSAYMSKLPLPSTVSPRTDVHPPLYYLLLNFWVRLTGSSVFALRFLSLVLGLLTVPLVYRLARLAFGVSVGLLAALLCAISPFQVYYSQEARMHALATFSTTLSMFLLARLVSSEREQSRPRRFSDAILPADQPDNQGSSASRSTAGNLRGVELGLWIAYFLATAAAIFTYYYALFVVVAENALLMALWRRDRGRLRRWLAVQAALVLSYLPWVLAQRGFLGGQASARFNELTLPVLISILKRSLVAFSVGTTVKLPLGGYLTLAFLLLVALGLVVAFRHRTDGDGWQPGLFLTWLVIPLIFAWLVNPITPFFQERYLLVVAPAFIVLVALGLSWVGGRSPWALALGLLFVVSAGSISLHNWFFDHAYTKGEYKLMMDYVRDRAQQGDLLLLNNPLQGALFDYYRPSGVPYLLLSRDDLHTEDRADQALAALTEGYSRVWLVMFGYVEQYDPDHLAERWLSEHGYRSSYRSFLGAYLTLYVMSPSGVGSSMQHTVAANLGNEALLVGYSLSAGEIKAGETLMLTLYWQALAEMERRYTVFVHLLDADNHIVAQMDSEPLGGTHPTTEWQLGEIVRDNYGLLIAPDTPPGEYLLEVGMYYLPTLERLPVLEASGNVRDDRVVLGTIQQARE